MRRKKNSILKLFSWALGICLTTSALPLEFLSQGTGAGNLEAGVLFEATSLILQSERKDFNRQGAETTYTLEPDLYVLSYSDSSKALAAYECYQTMDGIEFVEPNRIVETADTDDKWDGIETADIGGKWDETEVVNISGKWKGTGIADTDDRWNGIIAENIDGRWNGFEAADSDGIENESETENSQAEDTELLEGNEKASESATELQPETDSVMVAVIDTGVDAGSKKIAPYLYSLGDGTAVNDENGHGTQIMGILAESFLNAGLNPKQICILPVKAADKDGKSTVLQVYLAIKSALDAKADILNISMGAKDISGSPLLQQALWDTYDNNVIVVTSAGNNGDDVTKYTPANVESVITVGAVDEKKNQVAFSNYGATLDCVAYGQAVNVTGLNGEETTESGTSYSAAFVTAELAKQKAGGVINTPEAALDYIKNNAEDLGVEGWDAFYGYGFIGIYDYSKDDSNIETETISTEAKPEIDSEKMGTVEDATKAIANYADSGTLTKAQQAEMRACLAYGDIIADINSIAETQDIYSATGLVSIAKTKAVALQDEIQAGYVTARYLHNEGYVTLVTYHCIGNEAVDLVGADVTNALQKYAQTGTDEALKSFIKTLDIFFNTLNETRNLSIRAESTALTELVSDAAESAASQLQETSGQLEDAICIFSDSVRLVGTESAEQWQRLESRALYDRLQAYSASQLQYFVDSLSDSDMTFLSGRLGSYYQDIMAGVYGEEIRTESNGGNTYYIASEAALRMYGSIDLIGEVDDTIKISASSGNAGIPLSGTITLTSDVTVNYPYIVDSGTSSVITSSNGSGMILGSFFSGTNLSMIYVEGALTLKGDAVLNGNNLGHNAFLVWVRTAGTFNIKESCVIKNNNFTPPVGAGDNGGYGNAVHNEGKTTMSGGTIKSNYFVSKTAPVTTYLGGGGAAIGSSGTLSITSGTITDNYANYGAVWVFAGTAAISGGSFYKNVTDAAVLEVNSPFDGVTAVLNVKGTSDTPVKIYDNNGHGIDALWNATVTISTAYNYIYGNTEYGIRNQYGTLNITGTPKIGFSSYTSLSDYTADANEKGGIYTASTTTISNMARIFTGTGGTGIWNDEGNLTISSGSELVVLCSNTGANSGISNNGKFVTGKIMVEDDSTIYPYTIYGTANQGIANTGEGTACLYGRVRGNYNVTKSGIVQDDSVCGFTNGIYNTSAAPYSADSPYAVILAGVTDVDTGAEYFGYVNYCVTGIYNSTTVGKIKLAQGKVCNNSGNGINNKGTLDLTDADGAVYGNAANAISNSGTVNITGGLLYKNDLAGISNSGTVNVSDSDSYIYGNGTWGIANSGTANISDTASIGFSAYSSGTSYALNQNTSGAINNSGTLKITANAHLYAGTSVAVKNTGTFTASAGHFIGNGSSVIISNTNPSDGTAKATLSGGTVFGTSTIGIGVNSGTVIASGVTVTGSYAIGSASWASSSSNRNLTKGIDIAADGTVTLSAGTVSYATRGIVNTGTFNLSGGTVTKNGDTSTGTGIYNSATGTATLSSGTVSSNVSAFGGGGLYNLGTVTMTGGTITDNSVNGISNASSNAAVTISGGSVSANGTNGIQNTGTVMLSGGTITGNATNGITNTGAITMTGGMVTTNKTNGINNGDTGTLTLSSGTISSNTTNGITNTGTVTMTGGMVSGNPLHGLYQNGTFNMSGAAAVNMNNDVCLAYGKVITVNGALTTSGTVAKITPLNKAGNELTKITSESDYSQGGLGTSVIQISYTKGKGSAALFYNTSSYRFVLSNGGIIRPGDYMNDSVIADEITTKTISNTIADMDIVISTLYSIIYDKNLDDIAVSMPSNQSKYWCEDVTLVMENPTVSDATLASQYQFLHWNTKADDTGAAYVNSQTYKENSSATIYAQWQTDINIAYIGNEQSKGNDYTDENVSQSEDYTFCDNKNDAGEEYFDKKATKTYTDEETGDEVEQEVDCTVVGWRLGNSSISRAYKLDEQQLCADIYLAAQASSGALTYGAPSSDYGASNPVTLEAVNIQSFNSGTSIGTLMASLQMETYSFLASAPTGSTNGKPYVNLYAVWDEGPSVEAYNLYYDLAFAQSTTDTVGITMEELLSQADAEDTEDGTLAHGKDIAMGDDKVTSFIVKDYAATDFSSFTTNGAVDICYQATDSVGNVTEKTVMVHIVDTTPRDINIGSVRFIDAKYLNESEENGGFADNSIWKEDQEYYNLLESVLNNEKIDTETADFSYFGKTISIKKTGSGMWETPPQETWVFTQEQVLAVHDYVDTNGIGNSKSSSALEGFLSSFAECKQ